jgi:hypothetical protein
MDVLIATVAALGGAVGAGIGILAAFRPDRVLQAVMSTSALGPDDPVMGVMSKFPPYRWLAPGGWRELRARAPQEPEAFPRVLTAIRSLGVVTVAILFAMIAAFFAAAVAN